MRAALSSMVPIARARRTTLISGATGTGKEVVARTLHEMGQDRGVPYVAVHCGALPEQLMDAELFGHTRGAFTGATQARDGILRSAHGGTLFLDEVDSLSLPAQAKLLRFLETGELRTVGADRVERVQTWVLAATNRDLRQAAMSSQFREDLLYRLEVMHIELPPLRMRGQDIERLAHHFLAAIAGPLRSFSPCALVALRSHDWPGNVRELKHRVERAALLTENSPIRAVDLGLAESTPAQGVETADFSDQLWRMVERQGLSLGQAVDLCERAIIEAALRAERDNRTRAAERLRIHVRTIFKKLSDR
jgi:DNA-binding NtrC family response regulator